MSSSLDPGDMDHLRRKQVPVTRFDVFSIIRLKMKQEKVLIALPLCCFLFVSFLGLVIFFERNTDRQAIVNAITDDIMENCNFEFDGPLMLMGFKNMDDVHSIRDIWQWMYLGFWPQVVWQSEIKGQYLLYNQIIGGARILTQTYDEDEAKCNSKIANKIGMKCMKQPEQDFFAIGMDDLAMKPRGIETFSWSAGPKFSGRSNVTYHWLLYHQNETLESHRSKIQDLQNNNLINRNVKHVQISVVMYNADMHMVALTEANFFLSRTGNIWPLLRIQTLDPDIFRNRWPNLYFLVIWCILLFLNIFFDIVSLTRLIRQVGLKNLSIHVPHGPLWYSMDVLGFMCGMMYLITLLQYYQQTQKINEALRDHYTTLIQSALQMETFLSNIETAEHEKHWIYRVVLIIYPITLLFRLGLAFAMQPLLSVTPRILIVAFTDLYHFLIVLCSCVLCFGCFGIVMFGRYLEDYSSFPRALVATVRMLFGDIDWEAMSVVGFVRAGVFYCLFQFTVGLVLFNVLLAIVLDSYEEVRGSMGEQASITLLRQAAEFFCSQRKIKAKERIALQVIWMKGWQAFGIQMLDDSPITLAELQRLVDGLQEAQAQELINEVVANQNFSPLQISDVYSDIMQIDAQLQQSLTVAIMQQRTSTRTRTDGDNEATSTLWPPTRIILPDTVEDCHGCFRANKLNLSDVAGVLALARSMAKDASPLVQKSVNFALQTALANGNHMICPSTSRMLLDSEDNGEISLTVDDKGIRPFGCMSCSTSKRRPSKSS